MKNQTITTNGSNKKRKVPFIPILSLYGSKLTGYSLKRHYTDPNAYIEGQIAISKELNSDCVVSPLFYAGIGEAYGGTIKFSENQPPNLLKPVVSTPEEYLKLKVPDVDTNSSLLYIRDAVKGLKKECDKDVMVCGVVLNPIDLPIIIMGMDNWMDTLLFNNSKLDEIFERNIKDFVTWGNTLLDDGADFLCISSSFLSNTIAPRYLVENTFLPVLEKALSQINGSVIIHNTGSTVLGNMDLFSKLPNVIGFFASPLDSLEKAHNMISDDQLFISGIEGSDLSKLTHEQVYSKTLKLLDDVVDIDKFIMGTPSADMQLDIPIENFKAITKAIVDYDKGIRYEKEVPVSCVSCTIFKEALDQIQLNNPTDFNFDVQYCDSALHMDPNKFAKQVFPIIAEKQKNDDPLLVIYGDCHPDISKISKDKTRRIGGTNCAEIFLGNEVYTRYQKQKTFFVLPEWSHRWREVFENELGFFDDEFAKDFMGEYFNKILFINLTDSEIANKDSIIKDISKYTGLNVEEIYITTKYFEENIRKTLTYL